MSSSASRGGGTGERMVHQDFIARIRFSNTLPPPPNPPKLLDIPNTGLGSSHYTTPGFASRLAREQPLNIEADAELGMPLDLTGMPGVFDGDESSIQALPHPPPIHPHDRALLKPLSSLGKPRTTEASVSFLRRTEYISAGGAKAAASPLRASAGNGPKRAEKRRSPEPDSGTPAYVKRKIEKSFEAAQMAARDRYSRVRHPTKKNLRLVGAYPLLPDLGAFPDSGAYVTLKFSNNPVTAGTGVYDTRLLSGIFKPIEQSDEERAAFEAALKVWERDPQRNPRPQNRMQYDFFLPDTATAGESFRGVFDSASGEGDGDRFSFSRVRAYESAEEKELSHTTKYSEEILLAFADNALVSAPDLGGRVTGGPGAALYYPVMQRTVVRSQRGKPMMRDDEVGGHPMDRLQVSVHEPPEDMLQHIARIRADPLHFHEAEEDAEGEEDDGGHRRYQHHDDDDDDDDDDRNGSVTPGRTNGKSRGHVVEDEDDAEGEEED
ncbi:RNA polymerase ii-associated, paf1 [Grosmannia clavigera kw1407]|uniref:RNA polymerase ii-associated, paf1 n=1 Tax=Grosmannia clavigera (strain kw1407 / UAMH 11150) TaxID=655863 RepID=F0XUD9_GROCL|nr:RNA polymerase ii-associated, paf1 [Grosmannia clavigera kw1407]EFW98783.1 RNA polymerase ii-associated, paf1 [Grosmannia clavigera kw1407]